MRVWILALVLLVALAAPAAAQEAFGWYAVKGAQGVGVEVHRLVGGVGLQWWMLSEERESPGPAVSVTPIKATQMLVAAVYELGAGPFSVGAGVASIGYKETGNRTVGGALTAVEIEKDTFIGPVATARLALSEGALFADAQGVVSQKGFSWTARAGFNFGSFWAGAGFVKGPGDDPVGTPLVFLGSAF